jgi:glycosyltransferase involved in cell wall biosynthesis
MPLPKFSFSLPVYNEEARIADCLKNILDQDYPRENIEILVVDGGSTDGTKKVAAGFACVRLFDNPQKLADFGAKISVRESTGDLFVIFAADNGLAGRDWLRTAAALFIKNPQLSALWGRMVAAQQDPPLNRYYALIQNDPLSFFVNKNLQRYLKNADRDLINGRVTYSFDVQASRPLIWGANALVYRTETVKDIILREGFVADNDVFQIMIENGSNRVAYVPKLEIYHHHISAIKSWVNKWRRNYISHFLTKKEQRNLRWVFDRHFKIKLLVWIFYSGTLIFSLLHSIYLCIRDRSPYWLYHPVMNFMQMATYSILTFFTVEGRRALKKGLLRR